MIIENSDIRYFQLYTLQTVSTRVPESMRSEVSLSLPSIVDRHGIARVLPVALSSSEWRALEASAEVVRVLTAVVTKGRSISAYPAVGPEVTIAGREPGNGPAWPAHPVWLAKSLQVLERSVAEKAAGV
jgi:hypothetical protein